MPPRRNTRSAAAAERATSALAPLPLAVVLYIFSLLPVDCRLRCSEVCRGWRSVLLERSLWTRLELTAASGVQLREAPVGTEPWDGLLRCAAARAGGGLHSLRVGANCISREACLEVAVANGRALRELHHENAGSGKVGLRMEQMLALLRAAPQLRVFATDVNFGDDVQAVRRALRNEPPFAPLRVQKLSARLRSEDEAGVVALAADAAAHASLNALWLEDARLDTPAALDAVVDAALARRAQMVELNDCTLSPASVPSLARLLGGGALTKLHCVGAQLLNAPAAGELGAALRANATLTSLTLADVGVFDDAAVATELLGALTAHPSVRTLDVSYNAVDTQNEAAAGAALGALVAANAPALTALDASWCALLDDGLRPLFEALPRNTHLRALNVKYNGMSEAFTRRVLLPAVRANTSLRKLDIGTFFHTAVELEAKRIVQDRAAA
jgi:hypothetical protein